MPIVKIAPDFVVNTDNVESVEYTGRTDAYSEKHVLVNFKEFGHDISPEYTLEEITAAMNGGCYYREQWTDEVGTIDVCVLHGNNSRHDPAIYGAYRHCLTRDPYIEYDFPSLKRHQHEPSIVHSWEYRQVEHKKAAAAVQESFNNSKFGKPVVLTPEMMPSHDWVGNDDPKPPTPSDMLPYDHDMPHRPWWKRVFGIY